MRILMVTGSYPPDFCGVGAYTENLVRHLRSLGLEMTVESRGPWLGLRALKTVLRIRRIRADIIHIQYPAIGFGSGLAAQLLCLLSSRVVVTIHEVSQVHPLRKLALMPFLLKARHVIFTNEFERAYARRFCPWLPKKSSVIPLGSSIEAGTNMSSAEGKSENRVIHFGLIRPHKGLEDVLEAARLASARRENLRFLVVGTPDANSLDYSQSLKRQAIGLPIDWQTRLSNEDVATLLSQTRFAYMPFPDGATERRTSLLALYANGVVVVTTASRMTSEEMKEASVIANSPSEAVDALLNLSRNHDEEVRVRTRALRYIERFSWPQIAAAHRAIYERASN